MSRLILPFYNEKSGPTKAVESRNTEAVLNAVVLARYQSPAVKDALRYMWALQLKDGDKRLAHRIRIHQRHVTRKAERPIHQHRVEVIAFAMVGNVARLLVG